MDDFDEEGKHYGVSVTHEYYFIPSELLPQPITVRKKKTVQRKPVDTPATDKEGKALIPAATLDF